MPKSTSTHIINFYAGLPEKPEKVTKTNARESWSLKTRNHVLYCEKRRGRLTRLPLETRFTVHDESTASGPIDRTPTPRPKKWWKDERWESTKVYRCGLDSAKTTTHVSGDTARLSSDCTRRREPPSLNPFGHPHWIVHL